MRQKIDAENKLDAKGNPAGGHVEAKGLIINWQDGPLGRGKDRKEPNGCFVETVLAAALQRLEHYQSTKFKCSENAEAISHIEEAIAILNIRTEDREQQDVEGTHGVRNGKEGA